MDQSTAAKRREVQVYLPSYHERQQAFAGSPAKRKVIVAGRRGGKTTAAARMAVEGLLAGRRILEAAPTADQTTALWDKCKAWLSEPIRAGVIYKNETDRLLEMKATGGRIRAKTAWDADTLRGDYADLLILDEYSLMNPSAWNEVGAPMLLDNDGDAVFIFTPKRKNHAFALYGRAVGDTSGRWGAWHFTSLDNPHLSKAALGEITQDMTADAYKQEILAQFLDSEGQVFRNLAAVLTAQPAQPEDHKGHDLRMGVDWAKQQDFTCLSVFCVTCGREVAIDRFNQIDYAFQSERLKGLAARWAVKSITAESNAMGEPIIERLFRDGLPVTGFATTSSSKPPLIESLALAFEQQEAAWLDDAIWRTELEAYERIVSPQTNRSSYGAPPGMHDDTVIARALAWHDASTRSVAPAIKRPHPLL